MHVSLREDYPMVEKIMNDPGLSKVMLGAICALLAWNVYTTHLLAVEVAVIKEAVANLKGTQTR